VDERGNGWEAPRVEAHPSEARRAAIAAALGVAMGLAAAAFSRDERDDEPRIRWRGRSAT
jgi:hypothetical protein